MATRAQREINKKETRRKQELEDLKNVKVELHKPLPPKKPMEFKFDKEDPESFEYAAGIGNSVLEKKSDGYCVHVSINRKAREKIKIYSSAGNEFNPSCFPEITPALLDNPSGYYHGEILGLKPEGADKFSALDEFVAIENRPRGNASSVTAELLEKYPLKIDLFDVLRMENKTLLSKTQEERRAILEEKIETQKHLQLIPQWNISDSEGMQHVFLEAIANGYEGLVAKDPLSLYVPGSRDSDWLKLKEFTTFDLAIIGLYQTDESIKAKKPFSAVLVGSYNPKTKKFETMTKVKVGSIADQDEIMKHLGTRVHTGGGYEETVRAAGETIALNPAMAKIKRKIPNEIVLYNSDIAIAEIKVKDVTYNENWHTCGIGYDGVNAHSLRLPTYKQLRTDKKRISDVTTTQQIHAYYQGQ